MTKSKKTLPFLDQKFPKPKDTGKLKASVPKKVKKPPVPLDQPTRDSVRIFLRSAFISTWNDEDTEVGRLRRECERLEKKVLTENAEYQAAIAAHTKAYDDRKAKIEAWNKRIKAVEATFLTQGMTPTVKAMLKILTDERFPELRNLPTTENALPRAPDATDAPPASQLDGAPDRVGNDG